MADKTPAQLVQATDLLPGDLLTAYRQGTNGPMKGLLYDLLLSTLTTYFASTFLKASNYLSEISAAGAAALSQARSNLGLGSAAVLNVGQSSGSVAAGDDSRFAANASAAAAAASTANAALPASKITSGTAAPGTLANGVLYFQYTA